MGHLQRGRKQVGGRRGKLQLGRQLALADVCGDERFVGPFKGMGN